MVTKLSKRTRVEGAKALTEERKLLIERYTVEAEEDGSSAQRSPKEATRAPQAGKALRGGAEAKKAPADVEERAVPAAEADETHVADNQARLVAEAEVRRLTDEVGRLAAEAVRVGSQPPQQLDIAREAEHEVESHGTVQSAGVPIDVPPVTQIEVCHVDRWRGYLTCEFFARRPDDSAVAASGTFRWRKSTPPPDDGAAREAFERVVAELRANGWEERGRGALWYERRFERHANRAPLERDAASVSKSRP